MLSLVAALVTLASPAAPQGYLAVPKSGHGRGVLVLHAWWGLNDDIKSYCDQLARAGFEAFAPDMFQGKVVTTAAQVDAMALVKSEESRDAQIKQEVLEAAKLLERRTGNHGIGIIGISYGAYYTLWASNSDRKIRAVVLYYGTGPGPFTHSKASYMANWAGMDQFNGKADVDHLKSALQAAHRPVTYYIYRDVRHWFAEPSVKRAYNKEASDLAWRRTLSFLRSSLN